MTVCRLVHGYHHLGGACCLFLQGSPQRVIHAEEIGNYIELEQVRCSSVQLGVVALYRGFLLNWMMHYSMLSVATGTADICSVY